MLPLSLLKTAHGHPMLVELKNGETYNGHLVNCDTWMNIHLREVICTSKVIDKVQEETNKMRTEYLVNFVCVHFSDRKTPGVGRGRGRVRDDMGGRGGRGMGRGGDDGGAKGFGGGRGGRGGPSNRGGGTRGGRGRG
ncbi:hypothetical protein ACHQM5_012809 [Ranunculus cassubicifolius]